MDIFLMLNRGQCKKKKSRFSCNKYNKICINTTSKMVKTSINS